MASLALLGGPKTIQEPLGREWPIVTNADRRVLLEALECGKWLRPRHADQRQSLACRFQRAFAQAFGVKHAVAVTTGTTSLECALKAVSTPLPIPCFQNRLFQQPHSPIFRLSDGRKVDSPTTAPPPSAAAFAAPPRSPRQMMSSMYLSKPQGVQWPAGRLQRPICASSQANAASCILVLNSCGTSQSRVSSRSPTPCDSHTARILA